MAGRWLRPASLAVNLALSLAVPAGFLGTAGLLARRFEKPPPPLAPADRLLLGVCLTDPQQLANNLVRPPALLSRLHERSALVRWIMDAPGREIRSVQQLFMSPEAPEVRSSLEQFFGELRRLEAVVQ